MPPEWEVNLLKVLPKKGDLSEPGNYRGIMLLETAYKIVGNLLHARLKPIKEGSGLPHEPQCGFRPERGTTDASFSLKQALRKRREHGLETLVGLKLAYEIGHGHDHHLDPAEPGCKRPWQLHVLRLTD